MIVLKIILLSVFIIGLECGVLNNEVSDCDVYLTNQLKKEILSYQPLINNLTEEILTGNYKHSTYNELATFVDKFGNRLAGTQNLEDAIDYMLNRSNLFNLENVHGEEVQVTHWERGIESATLLEPRVQNLAILALGGSIGTPATGITAQVLAVRSFEELTNRSSEASGKIVVFVPEWVSYGKTVRYRQQAAARGAAVGAVATLVRSITPFSLLTPHAGWQDYNENITKIPTAAIAAEDAHLILRLQESGEKVKINLKMEARTLDPRTSRNTVVEIRGHENPEKVVIVSGHLDSWDVGQGAMDDGGGAFISWNALVILKALGLRPKRTVRAILWTAEEVGLEGAFGYDKAHENETQNFNFIMESDEGTFNPLGIEYRTGPAGSCIIEEIMKLYVPLNTTTPKQSQDVGSDIGIWLDRGIPGASLLNENDKYFWFHHSQGDTMDVEDPVSLDKSTALWASFAYIIADLSIDFPRG